MRSSKPSSKNRSQRYAPSKIAEEVELNPDAWPKFEDLIRKAAKASPEHSKERPLGKRTKS